MIFPWKHLVIFIKCVKDFDKIQVPFSTLWKQSILWMNDTYFNLQTYIISKSLSITQITTHNNKVWVAKLVEIHHILQERLTIKLLKLGPMQSQKKKWKSDRKHRITEWGGTGDKNIYLTYLYWKNRFVIHSQANNHNLLILFIISWINWSRLDFMHIQWNTESQSVLLHTAVLIWSSYLGCATGK